MWRLTALDVIKYADRQKSLAGCSGEVFSNTSSRVICFRYVRVL